jgi:hypothetical protein
VPEPQACGGAQAPGHRGVGQAAKVGDLEFDGRRRRPDGYDLSRRDPPSSVHRRSQTIDQAAAQSPPKDLVPVLPNRVFTKTRNSSFSQHALSWVCGNSVLLIRGLVAAPKHDFSLLDGFSRLRKTSSTKTAYPNKA